ncbi:MAG: hypothetical protein QOF30_659 [Acidimicrobiaceae bacterium]|jgi:hypothetical protein|nr:hypothetical protein [Acidimicrobiaceae bacterium]
MRVFRRICALSVSGLIVGGMLAGVAASTATSVTAGANTPETFAGTASAKALDLRLFGTDLTVGSTNVEADSSPKAHADGAGLALIAATVSSADADSVHTASAPPKACGLHLPIAGILNLELACSQSASGTANASPAAVATSNIAALDVGLLNPVLNLLQPVLNALTPIADQLLGTVLTQVQSVLQPVLGTTLQQLLGGLGLDTAKPVSSLLTALQRATNLVTVHVGDTVSSVVTSAGTVVADSVAKGAEIDVLPGLTLAGGPLLSITLGFAHTTSTFNRLTGASAATFDPAIVTVKLLGSVIPVGLTTPLDILGGTPLHSIISLGAGSKTVHADNSVSAQADGVGIDLLTGLNGGISLHLAHAESAAGGAKALVVATASTSTTTTLAPVTGGTLLVTKLPVTGTAAPVLPIGMALILAGYLTRRSLLRRWAQRTPR